MNKKAVISLEAGHNFSGPVRFRDAQKLFLPARRDERQHHHVRVAIEEHVLDKIFGTAETHATETVFADKMSLHVENELATAEL